MAFNYNASTKSYNYTPKDDPKDRVEVEIGDSLQSSQFIPQVKIKRWDNEVNLSYRLNYSNIPGNISYSSDGNTITWRKGQYEAHFYHVNDGEGAFEFDITIPKKPPINYLEFTLQDKDVEYFYQPFLANQNPDGSFWEEDEEGRRECPANVGGSYAVYAKTPKTNWTGGKEYKCGKVGHIFRPKIIDSAGTEVWGDLHIENGILSVTIPQDFLDNAVYPVRHTAGLTFGYTSVGLTAVNNGGARGNVRGPTTYTASSGDTITEYWVYTGASSNGINMTISAYSIVSGGLSTRLTTARNITANIATAWYSVTGLSDSLNNGTTYGIAIGGNQNWVVYNDAFTGNSFDRQGTNYTLNSTWSHVDYSAISESFYATYTAGGGAVATPTLGLMGVGS